MIHPLLYIIGYASFSVALADAAKFINLASRLSLVYHDMGERDGRRYFRTSTATYERALGVCRYAGIEVLTESRRGLPYLLLGLFRRVGLVMGIALCVFMAYRSQSVIWDIRIEGNSAVPDEKILGTLKECGVYVGADTESLDIDRIENRFLIISDEISWITVNLTGTVAEVEVREVASREVTPDYTCSNLVATRNGKVVEFFQVRGNIQVELGEEVSKGQLLVGGIYGSDTTPMRFVRSRGEVFAQCDREYTIDVPLKYEKKSYTGKQKIKKSLIFFEKEVKFFLNSGNSYASCDTIEEVKYFDFFGLGKLPFGIRTVRYAEYESEAAERSEETAAEEALYLLWQKFGEEAPEAQIVGKRLEGTLLSDRYTLVAEITSIENIATEKEVKIQIVE